MGKTTTAINLATALASKKRVLVIDLDPQGNASTGLGLPRAERGAGTYALLLGERLGPALLVGLGCLAAALVTAAQDARRP